MRTILSSAGFRAGLGFGLGMLAAASLAACATPGRRVGVRVVAAESVWGSLAAQVAGADVPVASVVSKPAADPHDYEPTPADARAFADARLVIVNGIGYDPWAQRLLDADPGHDRIVLDVGRVLGIGAGGNPHQWYSRAAVTTVIVRVAADLAQIDPAHGSAYERRAHDLATRGLAPYDRWVARIRQRFAGASIGASESLASVWAGTLGLRVITPPSFLDAVSEGNEPTASDKATVDAQIRDHAEKVFVYNAQNATPDVQRLVDGARAAGVPVVAITETVSPEHARFQDWQAREARDLYRALEEGSAR